MSDLKLDSAAAAILQRAVDFDKKNRFTEALVCYQEGLQLLVSGLKDVKCVQKKKYLRGHVENYMSRAEQLKKLIEEQKNTGKYHEQIQIENDSVGHSYKSLFGRFLEDDITSIYVEDPYIRTHHQCQNFLRFCELVVLRCPNLKLIHLLTHSDGSGKDQCVWLRNIGESLLERNVKLSIDFSGSLHDRQIKLSNGWIIKIGRGLDYFKPTKNKYCLGYYDMDLRPCLQTTVDIFHIKDVLLSADK